MKEKPNGRISSLETEIKWLKEEMKELKKSIEELRNFVIWLLVMVLINAINFVLGLVSHAIKVIGGGS
jgi:peptidoglycan hydrolase CwlO-like protein